MMLSTLALSTTLALTGCEPTPSHADINQALVSELESSYQAWAESSEQLAKASQQFCADKQPLDSLQTQWRTTFEHWSALQPAQIGPIAEHNRAWQVQFWPDKKNLVARQVNALLQAQPKLEQAHLEQASVVLQGLSAAEYLLFDATIDLTENSQKTRYCGLLSAIGQHQATLARTVSNEWAGDTGFSALLSKSPNARFADEQESTAELLRSQVSGLELMKKKLAVPVGKLTRDIVQPYQAEAWRADASLQSLRAGLHTLRTLWGNEHTLGLRNLAQGQAVQALIDQQHLRTEQAFAKLKQPLQALLPQESGRGLLNKAYAELVDLHRLYEQDLARALNVQMGFNAHDGD
ncbi:imelysin family protein [Atopomonas sediminilitoris]|uniref:imelysin family protein n=1 Tax=Atopomonas sediminilitoris TaxID=2919919 RepID=UPI001F4EA776|nr:imelysin family protein [Atopomonas sediminilitoris]MCJ8168714.1 imelysin [Atopomonas sediminilitoris]